MQLIVHFVGLPDEYITPLNWRMVTFFVCFVCFLTNKMEMMRAAGRILI
jgi:hypothetical protein